jgi:hypothetical protein
LKEHAKKGGKRPSSKSGAKPLKTLLKKSSLPTAVLGGQLIFCPPAQADPNPPPKGLVQMREAAVPVSPNMTAGPQHRRLGRQRASHGRTGTADAGWAQTFQPNKERPRPARTLPTAGPTQRRPRDCPSLYEVRAKFVARHAGACREHCAMSLFRIAAARSVYVPATTLGYVEKVRSQVLSLRQPRLHRL